MPYAESFSIASNSKPGLCYTVTRSQANDWQCTCPHWTYRRTECAHIRTAQSLPATESIHKPEPPIVYAHVREVTPQPDGSLYVPSCQLGTHIFSIHSALISSMRTAYFGRAFSNGIGSLGVSAETLRGFH